MLARFWSGPIGAATCGLVIASVMYAERADTTDVSLMPVAEVVRPQSPIQLPGSGQEIVTIPNSGENAAQPSLFQKFNEEKKPWVVPASLNYSPLGSSN